MPKQKPNNKISQLISKQYFEELVQAFPQVNFNTSKGLHYNMKHFASYTLQQPQTQNEDELKVCFNFQNQHIKNAHPDVENALNVLYCGTILCGGLNDDLLRKTIGLMGAQLMHAYKVY